MTQIHHANALKILKILCILLRLVRSVVEHSSKQYWPWRADGESNHSFFVDKLHAREILYSDSAVIAGWLQSIRANNSEPGC